MVGNKKKQKRKNKPKKGNKFTSAGEQKQLQTESEEREEDAQHAGSENDEVNANSYHKKRNHDDDDSDVEDKPAKKKKKKQPVMPSDSSDKKNKKSIRQMKREKHAERLADAQAVAKDQLKAQCLSYLSQWKHNKQNWKFMKAKQVWLYKNKFSAHLLPDASWPLFLEYFESAKGNIRNMLLDDSNKIIKQMDEWTESQVKADKKDEDDEASDKELNKPSDTAYKRARDLIQCLHE